MLPSPLNGFKTPIRSVSLRNRGQIEAVRLIQLDSLLGYLYYIATDDPAINVSRSFNSHTRAAAPVGGESRWKASVPRDEGSA